MWFFIFHSIRNIVFNNPRGFSARLSETIFPSRGQYRLGHGWRTAVRLESAFAGLLT